MSERKGKYADRIRAIKRETGMSWENLARDCELCTKTFTTWANDRTPRPLYERHLLAWLEKWEAKINA